MPGPEYYIHDGVHRAVALRENNVRIIPVVLLATGQPPQDLFVAPEQLHSPKPSVCMGPDGHHHLRPMIAWLATPAGRNRMARLIVEPLGEPGQTSSVPLAQVLITP